MNFDVIVTLFFVNHDVEWKYGCLVGFIFDANVMSVR